MPAPDNVAVLDRIVAAPGRALAAILVLHAVVWTALPALLYANLPLDLIEALTYGREWQLGYDKLPPLPWWLVEIVYRLAGHDFAYYLLAQAAVVTALWLVFLTARPIAGPIGALIAVLIVDGLHYFNYTATKFNHDVIQLPFWALAGFAFHRALRGGWLGHWLLLGLAIGISLWAKYFVVVLAVPLAAFLVFDEDARKTLATPGPYIAAAVALVTMAPHLVWLVQNDFLPFSYAEHRALPSRGLIDHVWHPFQFALGQAFFLVPSVLIAVPLFFPTAEREKPWRRRIRPAHRQLAGLRPDGDRDGDVSAQRPRNRGDVGLPAFSFSWAVACAERAAKNRSDTAQARTGSLGGRLRMPRHRIHCQLRDASELRPSLPGGVLPGRRSRA